jgi:polysaccharide export outer membrane protein
MRNRGAHLLRFVLAALFLTTAAPIIHAQQTSGNKADETKCQTPVTVTGAVIAPSRFELRRRVRLNEVLARAGGLTERAGKTVEITRAALVLNCDKLAPEYLNKEPGSVEVYQLDEVKRGSDEANPYLQPGDFVIVTEASVAYVTGRVVNPQKINIKDSITVSQAIAIAGGELPDGVINRVRIIRPNPYGDSAATEIVVDLKAIRKGRAKDVVLQPYDIVEVPGKREHPWQPRSPLKIELPLRIIY